MKRGRVTAAEAIVQGFAMDRTSYPWVAYKGARFNPDELIYVYTPAWPWKKKTET